MTCELLKSSGTRQNGRGGTIFTGRLKDLFYGTFVFVELDEADLREALRDILREEQRKAGADRPAILSVSEAAAFLKLQTSTLYEKSTMRLIPHFKRGNRLYFHREELEAWLPEERVKTRKELQGEASALTMSRKYK